MRITELLQDATIDLGVKVNSKEEAIDHLVDLMVKGGNITDREEYKKGILAREANGTTGIGGGIAIPHSKNKAVTKAGLASMTVPDGVDYEAMDGEPSDVFCIILPSAVPGILSGVILGIGRIVGETAALMYTAGTIAEIPANVMGSGRTLALHMYVLSCEGLHINQAYATAVVLLLIVLVINAVSSFIAKRITKG